MAPNVPAASGAFNPLDIINTARRAVPAVDFALAIAGVAAAASIVLYFVGRGPAAFIIMGGTLIAMILMFVFAAIVKSGRDGGAGIFLLWAVVIFFTVFLVFTVTAVAAEWPPAWARLLGFETTGSDRWSFSNCQQEETLALADFNQNPTRGQHIQELINCKNPMGYNLEGERNFYLGNYTLAEKNFDLALQSFPSHKDDPKPAVSQDAWQSNLANAYIETGKYDEALKLLTTLVAKTPADNDYRLSLGLAQLYKAKFDPTYYSAAIETFNALDASMFGHSDRDGRVQILLAAANIGKSDKPGLPDTEIKTLRRAGTSDWCAALKRQPLWADYLKGNKPYPWSSLTEEKRLLANMPKTCPT